MNNEPSAGVRESEAADFDSDTEFYKVWAVKEAQGYHYGPDALEQVRFGFHLATGAQSARIRQLEGALRFYADSENYVCGSFGIRETVNDKRAVLEDFGNIAQAALSGKSES